MESAVHIVSQVLGGGAVIGLISLIVKQMVKQLSDDVKDETGKVSEKIDRLGEITMTKELCGERRDNIQANLEQGDKHFGLVDKKIDELKVESHDHSLMLNDIQNKVAQILKNGNGDHGP